MLEGASPNNFSSKTRNWYSWYQKHTRRSFRTLNNIFSHDVGYVENCFNWMMNQIIKSLHGKWLEITISIHVQLAVWGSRMVCLFVFFCWSIVSSNKKSKILYFDIMKSTMCLPQVDISCKTKNAKTKRKKQRMLPPKKTMQAIWKFFVFFGQRIHPSFSACRSFFFVRCQRPVSGGLLGGGHGILRRGGSGLGQ